MSCHLRTGLACLSTRGLVSLSGPDAAKFLQGMITQNVSRILDRPQYAGFLNAQGRILHDVFIYRDFEREREERTGAFSFLIDVDAAETERLQNHIRRHKLRAKFETRIVDPAELCVWASWDDGADEKTMLRWKRENTMSQLDCRAPGMGVRLVHAASAPESIGLERVPESAHTVRRYLAGVAEGQEELLYGQALPHESNMDVMGGVDFGREKGCYVGQELTIRTQHRGVVRKRVLPCVLYAEDHAMPTTLTYRPTVDTLSGPAADAADTVPGGTSIGRAGKTGRSAGKWLRGLGNLGLALCRLETMTDVVLPGETTTGHDREDEFVVLSRAGGDAEEDGMQQTLKLKAFVPDWLRQSLGRKR